MRSTHTTIRILSSLLALGLMAACEQYELSDRAIRMNAALGDAANRQVLLNAARSSKRYPILFTAVTQINSTGYGDGSQIGFTIPFGPGSSKSYSFAPTLKVQEGLTVQSTPLDTQEFYQGILAPVPTETVGYYLANGWNPQLIYYALLNEIDIPQAVFEKLQAVAQSKCDSDYSGWTRLERQKGDDEFVLTNRVYRLDYADAKNQKVSKFRKCISLPDEQWLNKAGFSFPAALPVDGTLQTVVVRPQVTESIARCATAIKDLDRATANHYRPAFINRPTDLCEFVRWEYAVQILDKLGFKVAQAEDKKTTTEILGVKAAPGNSIKDSTVNISVQNTATASDSGAEKSNPKFGFSIPGVTKLCKQGETRKGADDFLIGVAPLSSEGEDQRYLKLYETTPQNLGSLAPETKSTSPSTATSSPSQPTNTSPWCDDIQNMNVVVRSPEAVIFYMGLLMETQDDNGLDVRIKYKDLNPDPLFAIKKNDPYANRAVVSVELDGDTYSYTRPPQPADARYDQTMHFLSLAEEIVDLQKKGTKSPGIPVVQVLGQ